MSEAETTGILRKMMFWEYGLFARLTLGSNNGDLQSCYDRIMSFFSNIAARKKEMWKEHCISPYFTQNIKLRLLASQLHERRDLIEGEGQGKGDVGTLWDII